MTPTTMRIQRSIAGPVAFVCRVLLATVVCTATVLSAPIEWEWPALVVQIPGPGAVRVTDQRRATAVWTLSPPPTILPFSAVDGVSDDRDVTTPTTTTMTTPTMTTPTTTTPTTSSHRPRPAEKRRRLMRRENRKKRKPKYKWGGQNTTTNENVSKNEEIIRFEDRTEPNAQTQVTNSVPETTVPQSVDGRLVDWVVFANALQSAAVIFIALFVGIVALCRLVHKLWALMVVGETSSRTVDMYPI